ncbi:hypothetical protein NIES4075_67200 [Tolypothrix sp. NIES-4075]|uniref:hypothetical protein n=1 Tax=Tolypothrix sp. NIES-4075 TaxID=2005459 RepID=UPI000B5CC6C9|nr:hypothetical protein [Tolypothrix sp. NIES-4075]GAX45699.1 hypothetical protein NIES4075_67200 [Tolypothrix sp. NIES-4075]
MAQPIGKFTNYTFGDGGLLEKMETVWGNGCEDLKPNEKLWMIGQIASELWQATEFQDENISDDAESAADRVVKELSFSDALGVIECLLTNLRYS